MSVGNIGRTASSQASPDLFGAPLAERINLTRLDEPGQHS
jgi:hypothetical protein